MPDPSFRLMSRMMQTAFSKSVSVLDPKPTSRFLVDHVVGAGKEKRRNGATKFFGGLKVEPQIKGHGLLDRNIGCLFPVQNLGNHRCRMTENVGVVGAISEECARCRFVKIGAHIRQTNFERQVSEPSS